MTNNADLILSGADKLTNKPVAVDLQILLEAPDATTKAHSIDQAQIDICCRTALSMQSEMDFTVVSNIELSVQFVHPSAMQSLNEQYRSKNVPTNVLSFESQMPPMRLPGEQGALQVLGDLVFCQDVVLREAQEQNKIPEHHWKHLFVHGTLHLCGYDHEEPTQAEAMESLEIKILSVLGIPDPYGISE